MTGPTSTPRGERAGAPGVTWEQHLVRVETVIDDTAPDSQPNRAARRALKRANRKKNR